MIFDENRAQRNKMSSTMAISLFAFTWLAVLLVTVRSVTAFQPTSRHFGNKCSSSHWTIPFIQRQDERILSKPRCYQHVLGQSSNPRTTRTSSLFMAVEAIDDVTLLAEEKMEKSIDSVVSNLATIRTGRANAAILDRVQVEYYGAPTPLNQLASISVASAQQLTVDPYDKSATGEIEKAITEADLGIMPTNDGTLIRLNIPALTEDRRKELLKQCKGLGEDGKVALRNIRRDAVDKLKKLEKASDISKDQSADGQDEVQKLTDKYAKDIDTLVTKKEKEIMTV